MGGGGVKQCSRVLRGGGKWGSGEGGDWDIG